MSTKPSPRDPHGAGTPGAAPAVTAHPAVLLGGSANPGLAAAVAARSGIERVTLAVERFPDGELHVTADERVRGAHVYLLQPTGAPAERHLLELLFAVDACHRAGARSITAIIPYFGYARQDRRTAPGEAVGLRVVADMLAVAHVDRIVTVDPHAPTLEAIAAVPVTSLTAVPVLAAALEPLLAGDPVLVAPDLGAVKLAERYSRVLDLPVAVVRKTRISGAEVRARHVLGDVDGRTPVIVDDMISTGATIAAAVDVVTAAGARAGMLVAATHGVLSGTAVDVLAALPVRRTLVTDTLVVRGGVRPGMQIVSVAQVLADAIGQLVRV